MDVAIYVCFVWYYYLLLVLVPFHFPWPNKQRRTSDGLKTSKFFQIQENDQCGRSTRVFNKAEHPGIRDSEGPEQS